MTNIKNPAGSNLYTVT